MTILGPILMAAMVIVPVIISRWSDVKYEVAVVDDTHYFYKKFPDTDQVNFTYLPYNIDEALDMLKKGNFHAVLHIPEIAGTTVSSLRMFSKKPANMRVKLYIENILKNEFEAIKLASKGLSPGLLREVQTNINIPFIRIKDDGREESSIPEAIWAVGFLGGFMIYMFVFMFASQVMRGVMEEKTSRIIEVIVSSVKPFQLMMGKITGVALVGLTQFLLWIVLTATIVGGAQLLFPERFKFTDTQMMYQGSEKMLNPQALQQKTQELEMQNTLEGKVLAAISSINFPVIILCFLFYFLGGYILYAALFAAIGAAVDSESDLQQFMMPVTIPLLFSLIMAQFVLNNPSGPVAFWLSIIPLTSPVVMMLRIPFGVPYSELILSMALLILGFLGAVWLASKIYRTGILMYGKKVTYRELWKWLTYKR